MRQEYVTITFVDGVTLSDIHCESTDIIGNGHVLILRNPYSKNGIPSDNEANYYPLANIQQWSTKRYG